jgi:hypothetical protein
MPRGERNNGSKHLPRPACGVLQPLFQVTGRGSERRFIRSSILHWANPTTLQALGMLIEQTPMARLVVVGTYRPELTPPWAQCSRTTPFTLNRLERPEVVTMVGHLADGRPCPANWSIISWPMPTACRSLYVGPARPNLRLVYRLRQGRSAGRPAPSSTTSKTPQPSSRPC